MSGILRNTLRLVGTNATNNSTKYLRSMTVTTNRLNYSWQSPGPLTNVWTTIRAAGKKILSPIDNDIIIQTSKIGAFEVSLSNSNLKMMTSNLVPRNLILPPIFRTELNGKSIKPESNENIEECDIKKRSLKFWDWDLLLHGTELRLKLDCSREVFILKHEIHFKAFQNPPKPVDDDYKRIAPKLDRFLSSYFKITKVRGLESAEWVYQPEFRNMPSELYLKRDLPESLTKKRNGTDQPNIGRMKLQFPMTVLLEGAPHKMKIKDSDDYFLIGHTVTIQAMTDTTKKTTNRSSKPEDVLRLVLSSGDIKIKTAESAKQTAIFRHEVDIKIDLINEIPSILVFPAAVTARVYE